MAEEEDKGKSEEKIVDDDIMCINYKQCGPYTRKVETTHVLS